MHAQSCWTLIHDMISRKKGKIEREGNKTEKKIRAKTSQSFQKNISLHIHESGIIHFLNQLRSGIMNFVINKLNAIHLG